jgi:hypothetical protein
MQPVGRRGSFSGSSYKPFLHHISKSKPQRRRTIKLKDRGRLPHVLTVQQV